MGQMDDAWNDVGEQFGALGSLFAQHFEKQSADEDEADPAVTQEQLDSAVSKLKQGLETAMGSASNAAKDPSLKEGARASASSVLDAVGATLSEVGGEISNRKAEGEDGEEGDATA